MKKQIFTILTAAVLTIGSFNVSAQQNSGNRSQGQGHGQGHHSPFGLTEDQTKKFKEINEAAEKKTFQLDLQIKEKKAHLNTLRYAEKADLSAINNTVEEIGKLKIEKDKIREEKLQQLRKVLNDEQRAKFDKFSAHGAKHHGKKPQGFDGRKGQHDAHQGHPSHQPQQKDCCNNPNGKDGKK